MLCVAHVVTSGTKTICRDSKKGPDPRSAQYRSDNRCRIVELEATWPLFGQDSAGLVGTSGVRTRLLRQARSRNAGLKRSGTVIFMSTEKTREFFFGLSVETCQQSRRHQMRTTRIATAWLNRKKVQKWCSKYSQARNCVCEPQLGWCKKHAGVCLRAYKVEFACPPAPRHR